MNQNRVRKISIVALLIALIMVLSGCDVSLSKLKSKMKSGVEKECIRTMDKIGESLEDTHGDSEEEKKQKVAFFDVFSNYAYVKMGESFDIIEEQRNSLLDYVNGELTTFENVANKEYDDDMFTAEFEAYTEKKTDVYHIYLVGHKSDEERNNLSGLWSISIVDDDLYQKKNFKFGTEPAKKKIKCGVFIGDDAIKADVESSANVDAEDYLNKEVKCFEKITHNHTNYSKKYRKELFSELEDVLNSKDQDKISKYFSYSALQYDPDIKEQLGELTDFLDGDVKLEDFKEETGTGSNGTSYLKRPNGERYVAKGNEEWMSNFSGKMIMDDKTYNIEFSVVNQYKPNSQRVGIWGISITSDSDEETGEIEVGQSTHFLN